MYNVNCAIRCCGILCFVYLKLQWEVLCCQIHRRKGVAVQGCMFGQMDAGLRSLLSLYFCVLFRWLTVSYPLLQEKTLEIEYIRAIVPRKEEEPCLHNDWVSAVDGSSPRYVQKISNAYLISWQQYDQLLWFGLHFWS